MPSFSDDKDTEHQGIQYSSLSLINATRMSRKSGGNTGQKNATGNPDKAHYDSKSFIPLKVMMIIEAHALLLHCDLLRAIFPLCIGLYPHYFPSVWLSR